MRGHAGQIWVKGIGWHTQAELDGMRALHPSSIYALVDPRDSRIRYVGHTSLPLRERLRAHLGDALRGNGPQRRRAWLRELHAAGLEPEVVELQETNYVDGQALEERTIAAYVQSGHDLLNIRGVRQPLPAPRERNRPIELPRDPRRAARVIHQQYTPAQRVALVTALMRLEQVGEEKKTNRPF